MAGQAVVEGWLVLRGQCWGCLLSRTVIGKGGGEGGGGVVSFPCLCCTSVGACWVAGRQGGFGAGQSASPPTQPPTHGPPARPLCPQEVELQANEEWAEELGLGPSELQMLTSCEQRGDHLFVEPVSPHAAGASPKVRRFN